MTLSLTLLALMAPGAEGSELAAPVRLKAAGEYIDTDIGHAAPYVYDIDGDGKRDLLVGQFGDGKLRIYKNEGSNDAPDYAEVAWFHARGELVKVPTG